MSTKKKEKGIRRKEQLYFFLRLIHKDTEKWGDNKTKAHSASKHAFRLPISILRPNFKSEGEGLHKKSCSQKSDQHEPI
jgi:hypothetical protein